MGQGRHRAWFRVVWIVVGVNVVIAAGALAWGAGVFGGGKAARPADRTQAGAVVVAMSLPDPAGDTADDTSRKPVAEARADIVGADAGYGPGGIRFAMQVAQPTDPRSDVRWMADGTYAMWAVDTDGDSAADYEIQYFNDDGELTGSVSRPGQYGAQVCGVSTATYDTHGYEVTVDPACLGRPASFTYRAQMLYDTNPSDDDSTVAADTAPDTGWSEPVRSNG